MDIEALCAAPPEALTHSPSQLESHPWWHLGGEVKQPPFLEENWCFLGLLVCEHTLEEGGCEVRSKKCGPVPERGS